MKATIRDTNDPQLQRVFVSNWAFPTVDYGFHSPTTARAIKRLFDKGMVREAMDAANLSQMFQERK